MKIVLLGLALILGGTAVVVRSSETLLAAPSRAPMEAVQAESLAVESTSPEAVEIPRTATAFPVPGKAVASTAPSLPAPLPQALVGALERMLQLTPLQKTQAAEIYRERDQQVEAYGREVARRGWAKLADFDLRVGEIRDLSHRRLAAILDTAQASVFALRIAKGIPEDSLSIEIPDGAVVLE